MSQGVRTTLLEFMLRVSPEPNTGCWLWTGDYNRAGYGRVSVDGRNRLAHRAVWTLSGRCCIDGKCVCHRCDQPACVNPDHLFLGTQLDNIRDMVSKRRGSNAHAKKLNCPKGHPYDASNTLFSRDSRRSRMARKCRTCRNEQQRAKAKIAERGSK